MTETTSADVTGLPAQPFRPLSFFAKAPPVVIEAADTYAPGVARPGRWPSPRGTPSQSGQAGEPLLFSRWRVAWHAALGDAGEPDSLVVGDDCIVVNGRAARRLFSPDGQSRGQVRRGSGTCLIDTARGRLLADAPGGGLCTYLVPGGAHEARIALAAPGDLVTVGLIEGPGVLVLVSAHESPIGPPRTAIVQTVRVRDYTASKDGIHYGIEPLAGIVRDADGDVRAAAAAAGPVLATSDGVLFCDWQLRPLSEQRFRAQPVALSVDREGRACLLSRHGNAARLHIVPPSGPVLTDIALPWRLPARCAPPLVAADGRVFVVAPDGVVALDPGGAIEWTDARGALAPATVTTNGLLLLCDDRLVAMGRNGQREPLWQPPAQVTTATVLAGGRLHLATAEALFVLEPVP